MDLYIGDDCYDVRASVIPGLPATWDDPASPPEVDDLRLRIQGTAHWRYVVDVLTPAHIEALEDAILCGEPMLILDRDD